MMPLHIKAFDSVFQGGMGTWKALQLRGILHLGQSWEDFIPTPMSVPKVKKT